MVSPASLARLERMINAASGVGTFAAALSVGAIFLIRQLRREVKQLKARLDRLEGHAGESH